MFKTILVPTDGSALSRHAEDAAIEFGRRNGATLVVLAVAEPVRDSGATRASLTSADLIETPELLAVQELVQDLVARVQAADIPCQCSVAISDRPYEEILKAACDFHCDVIFMASHGRHGFRPALLGNETQKVLANGSLPVIVFR